MIVRMFAPSVRSPRPAGVNRVLGIDPGLTRCGYAVIDAEGPGTARAVSLGVLRTAPSDPIPRRLAQLQSDVSDLLREFDPATVAVEQLFFQVNVRTAMSVGQASGVVLALAAAHGCDVIQYTPNQVKQTIAGWGGADKAQVQKMVQVRLGLSSPPRPADAADAAAIALCHLATAPMQRLLIDAGAATVHGRVRSRTA